MLLFWVYSSSRPLMKVVLRMVVVVKVRRRKVWNVVMVVVVTCCCCGCSAVVSCYHFKLALVPQRDTQKKMPCDWKANWVKLSFWPFKKKKKNHSLHFKKHRAELVLCLHQSIQTSLKIWGVGFCVCVCVWKGVGCQKKVNNI